MTKHLQVSILKKRLLGLVIFIWLFNATHAYAGWDPKSCIAEGDNKSLKGLSDPRFRVLKDQVVQHLADSWCTAEKAGLMMDLVFLTRPQVCVEIGAFSGSTVLPVAVTLKYLGLGDVYAIDAWSNSEALKYIGVDDPNYVWWSWVNMQNYKDQFLDLLDQWSIDSYCFVIHAPSEFAVDEVPAIDFLHLDGNIAEEGATFGHSALFAKSQIRWVYLGLICTSWVNGKHAKMPSMWMLFDQCEIVCEIDNGVLFRKN